MFSRLIHPDKCGHPKASDAFSRLESAHRMIKLKIEQIEFGGKIPERP
jgi:hypothetical protein